MDEFGVSRERFSSAETIDCRDIGRVKLSLVVPVYNEVESIGPFLQRVSDCLGGLPDVELEAVFVNDGSSDGTVDMLRTYQVRFPWVRVVDLSRNFGKEAALTAGLKFSTGRVVVPIDVDMQDPPELIPEMLNVWRGGFDVVLAKRVDRAADSWVKRSSADWFYRIHNWIAEPRIPENVGDFRLMDRMVVDALSLMPESRRFMKGLFAWVGFRVATVSYRRPVRHAGASKFNGWRLWNLAIEGFTSFSTDALRIWFYVGGFVALISFLFAVYIIFRVFIYGIDVPGYASVIVSVTFLGGLQLLGIGVIGEYLGRTYIEAKRRPVYLVRKVYEAGVGRGSERG